ncbi:hypothetical protein CCM_03825 [Cordyceps militaris CM01]|uniref:Uncharacterized protein n=1 Tax=Cordyceps militaris (strain CM01) TaxID=983644 RepID=G3JGT8_CORMM|nr:uncharacterized protein CCM_03825 [Cordyceps militaris CM01]EGX92452.1 hypothetical protein CCM_03825 [Cordyceps militaris CM01]
MYQVRPAKLESSSKLVAASRYLSAPTSVFSSFPSHHVSISRPLVFFFTINLAIFSISSFVLPLPNPASPSIVLGTAALTSNYRATTHHHLSPCLRLCWGIPGPPPQLAAGLTLCPSHTTNLPRRPVNSSPSTNL